MTIGHSYTDKHMMRFTNLVATKMYVIVIININDCAALFWVLATLSQGFHLHTRQNKQNIHTQTSLPRVGFEPIAPAFENAETMLVLGRAVIVIGQECMY
jgi:hypothetical protein